MVPAASDKVPRASPYSGFLFEFIIFRIRGSHPLSLAFPYHSTILWLFPLLTRSYNPDPKIGLGSFLFARHYLGNRFFFLFLRLLRCFSSPGCSLCNYLFITWYWRVTTSGFPHSDISGSKLTYSSPKHFVVCHVLLHLLMPRHPHVRPFFFNHLSYNILIWWDSTFVKIFYLFVFFK